MKTALLDVNILVALLWPEQENHEKVQNWFKRHSCEGWATCPLTEAAFVRIVSNPAFSAAAVTAEEARKVLKDTVGHPQHEFWPADIDYSEAVGLFADRIIGHKQVPDAYLLGLAIHHRGSLTTMDRGIMHLLPDKLQRRGFVTLI
jgi:toxin-antitoxin system PIN domain toxin